MKKEIVSLLLIMLMLFSLLPVQALAEEVNAAEPAAVQEEPLAPSSVEEPREVTVTEEPSLLDAETGSGTGAVYTGELGENVAWSLDTGTGALTVTGSGPMGNYSAEGSPLWNYRGYVKSVTIADTVTTVGRYVFSGCVNLATVDFGNGITKIGGNAFASCNSLTEIIIPGSVTSIDQLAFCYCKALTKLVIGNGVTSVGFRAFYYCDALTEVTMGNNVTTVDMAFDSCYELQKVTITDIAAWLQISFNSTSANPLYYAHSLYVGSDLLTDLVIPDSVTTISQYALINCASITSVFIPQSIKTINQSAFSGMSSLKNVRYAGSQADWLKIQIGSYNDSLTGATPEYDQSLADYCRITAVATEHGTVAVDNTVAKVGDTVTITAIPAAGYAVESYLVDGVAIPDGGNTFTAAKDHVVTAAFVKAYDVADNGKACGDCGANIKWALDTAGVLHVYGTGAMYNYGGSDSPFYPYRADIKALQASGSITTIGNYAFWFCASLIEVVIPDGVTSIGAHAFEYCGNLMKIAIPDSVGAIGQFAFSQCGSLDTVTIGNGVTSIGSRSFEYCSNLTSAEFLGNAPTDFSSTSFLGVASAFTIFYHSGTTGWTSPTWSGYNAVCRDKITTDFSTLDDSNRNEQGIYFQLNSTSLTATVGVGTTAGNNAGYDGGQNGSIVIPDTVTKNGETYNVIGVNQYAFANCPWVNTISIGRYVSAITPSAFRGCKNLTAITVDQNNLQYADQDGVLYDKSALYLYVYPAGRNSAEYDIPASCVTIGTESFYGAANLKNISVPATVENIGARAFSGCTDLEEITLPFIGGHAEDYNTFKYVFGDEYWSSSGGVPQSLKTVTVLNANLLGETFANCTNIENIYLPNCGDLQEIPYRCFENCQALKRLILGADKSSTYNGLYIPDVITHIQSSAFYGCKSLESVTLGSGLRYIGGMVFYGCSGVMQYNVAEDNEFFMTDKWGVLYSKDMTILRYYPAARLWPYYNVAEGTTGIAESAFVSCENLMNLFVPESVTLLGTSQQENGTYSVYESFASIYDCPGMTVCCYMNSRTARYAIAHGLTPWYMDNYKMQGIKVTGLPEYTVVNAQGQVLSCSAYVTATYGDKELQLDNYTIQPVSGCGQQTLTFTSGNVSTEVKANVIRQGNINGNATAQSDIDASDMQCLYELLTTGQCQSQIKNRGDLELVADVNNDDHVDVYDLQRLYEIVSEINNF